MDPEWIIRRGYRFGRDIYWKDLAASRHAGIPKFLGIPRWMLRALAGQTTKSLWAKLRRNFEADFAARWEAQYLLGYCTEAFKASRSNRAESKRATLKSAS
jgi:hypothetical protein